MILIINLCKKRDSLGFKEFVKPVITIINEGDYEVKHYSEVNKFLVKG